MSWQLLPCKYKWQPEVSLPIPSFPTLEPITFRRTERFFITSFLCHYYPSEFLLHHLEKLNSFDASSLSSQQARAGTLGLLRAGLFLHYFPISRNENFPLSWKWEPFLSSWSVAAFFFFFSRAIGQLSNYDSAGKIFKRPKWDMKSTSCQVAGLVAEI